MKKIILLLLLSITLTGCTVQYNINIDNDEIKENTKIETDIDEMTEDEYAELTSDTIKSYLNDYKYYDVKYSEENNIVSSQFKYNHDISQFPFSRAIEMCYQEDIFKETEEQIIISTPKRFDCFIDNIQPDNPIDQIEINITTKLKVINNNADKKDGNTYTWIINESNYKNKPIEMIIDKKNTNTILSTTSVELIIILGTICLIAIFIGIFVKIKMNKNNKI